MSNLTNGNESQETKKQSTASLFHEIMAIISYAGTIILLYAIMRYWKELKAPEISNLLLVLSSSWGLHAIIHYLEEYKYNF